MSSKNVQKKSPIKRVAVVVLKGAQKQVSRNSFFHNVFVKYQNVNSILMRRSTKNTQRLKERYSGIRMGFLVGMDGKINFYLKLVESLEKTLEANLL